ncbi:DegT/DnrJ/EryC1/StrS aminotransferase family protein [Enterococcus casseliflavus]|uniref:DegT/DnrJ/EryC1/StrS family aminotransferase n=1 Tax=Enterococcus casseliflavus TaxID=37734 RepID=UPI0022563CAF|nr:DegT/DnrJ/EryC1/StrS aminotransferase family protein [Enterococcus casseliflavus]MCX4167983.1 DegT/DnrJ/EryC1/StrS aminotransferase family protein [Enterococcus casseliflavus]
MNQIPFSPPDITETEIEMVTEVLKSGWITTGPKTKEFEREISSYCGTDKTICLNSATACMELCLRLLGVGPGDEVITSAYTYTASASVINHVGAKLVLVDTEKDSYHLSYEELEKAITPNTKVIIPVDIAGVMCDYEEIYRIIEDKKSLFKPKNELQELFNRIIVLADAAHSFGAISQSNRSGNVADFTSFSFHAVKNLTTSEGGALTWRTLGNEWDNSIYNFLNIYSLHGQTKDALAKTNLGAWEYDIVFPAYKCNMTDIQAAIGLAQIRRYQKILSKREHLVRSYTKWENKFENLRFIDHLTSSKKSSSSYHLMMAKIDLRQNRRDRLITDLAEAGIATNVHYKPLPLLSAYKNMGFNINDFPNAMSQYLNEITFPLYQKLETEDVNYIMETARKIVRRL